MEKNSVKIDSWCERCYWCDKLYGDVIFVGKIYITKDKRNNYRRRFNIKLSNGKIICKEYARYIKEKEVGHKLLDEQVIHHEDENTLNDESYNLIIKQDGLHIKEHLYINRQKRGKNDFKVGCEMASISEANSEDNIQGPPVDSSSKI